MATLILDASVLIGLLDSADPPHAGAVDDVEAADHAVHSLQTPASAYTETLVAFARAKRVPEAREAVAGMGITVTPLTGPIAERAAMLRAAHPRLRLPDALVLATARELSADLVTHDDPARADRSTRLTTSIASDERVSSVEVKRSADRVAQRRFLMMIEKSADLFAEGSGWDGGDVIAGNDAPVLEAVGRAERDFGRQTADGGCDRRDGHGVQVGAHQFARQLQDRARLVQPRPMDRSHSRSTGTSTRRAASGPPWRRSRSLGLFGPGLSARLMPYARRLR